MRSPIFAIGTGGTRQCAMRPGGQWFLRERNAAGFWGRWHPIPKRPAHAWFDPRLGTARLPEDAPALTETHWSDL